MPDRLQELRQELALETVDKATIHHRVDAALDADPLERKRHMKHKVRFTAVLIAAVVALTGTALAAGSHASVLRAFFQGDVSVAEPYVNDTVYSASDENFTFAVESSVADDRNVYLIVRVDALNDNSAAILSRDDFVGMYTFHIEPYTSEGLAYSWAQGTQELTEYRTETSRTWQVSTSHAPGDITSVHLRLSYMTTDKEFTVPVTAADSITLTIGDTGLEGYPAWVNSAIDVTVDTITISPLSFTYQTRTASNLCPKPLMLFHMKDGSWQSNSQLISPGSLSGSVVDESATENTWIFNFQFRSVQDLSQIESVVFFGRAYPLDGSAPYEIDVPEDLLPFTIERTEPLAEDAYYSLPVRALTEGLGGVCTWDSATGDVTCVYRDTTIVLHPGRDTATVNGETVELAHAPAVQNGVLAADIMPFIDAWDIYGYLFMEDWNDDGDIDWESECGDWYIIP